VTSDRREVRDSAEAPSDDNDTVGPIGGGINIQFSERKSIPIVINNFGAQPDIIEVPVFRLHGLDWRVRVRKNQGKYGDRLWFDVTCLSKTITIKAQILPTGVQATGVEYFSTLMNT